MLKMSSTLLSSAASKADRRVDGQMDGLKYALRTITQPQQVRALKTFDNCCCYARNEFKNDADYHDFAHHTRGYRASTTTWHPIVTAHSVSIDHSAKNLRKAEARSVAGRRECGKDEEMRGGFVE